MTATTLFLITAHFLVLALIQWQIRRVYVAVRMIHFAVRRIEDGEPRVKRLVIPDDQSRESP